MPDVVLRDTGARLRLLEAREAEGLLGARLARGVPLPDIFRFGLDGLPSKCDASTMTQLSLSVCRRLTAGLLGDP